LRKALNQENAIKPWKVRERERESMSGGTSKSITNKNSLPKYEASCLVGSYHYATFKFPKKSPMHAAKVSQKPTT